jgi:ketosteroid isomerase-like protein
MRVTNTGNNFVTRMVRDASGTWRFQRFLATPAPRPAAPTPTVAAIAPASGSRPDAAAIERRMEEYETALRRNDPVTILGFWAEDGRYLQPNVELNDKAAISRFVNDAYAKAKATAVDIASEEMFLHDAVAYQLGSCSPCLVPGSSRRHHYIARWKRSADGQWLIDRFLATLAPRAN